MSLFEKFRSDGKKFRVPFLGEIEQWHIYALVGGVAFGGIAVGIVGVFMRGHEQVQEAKPRTDLWLPSEQREETMPSGSMDMQADNGDPLAFVKRNKPAEEKKPAEQPATAAQTPQPEMQQVENQQERVSAGQLSPMKMPESGSGSMAQSMQRLDGFGTRGVSANKGFQQGFKQPQAATRISKAGGSKKGAANNKAISSGKTLSKSGGAFETGGGMGGSGLSGVGNLSAASASGSNPMSGGGGSSPNTTGGGNTGDNSGGGGDLQDDHHTDCSGFDKGPLCVVGENGDTAGTVCSPPGSEDYDSNCRSSVTELSYSMTIGADDYATDDCLAGVANPPLGVPLYQGLRGNPSYCDTALIKVGGSDEVQVEVHGGAPQNTTYYNLHAGDNKMSITALNYNLSNALPNNTGRLHFRNVRAYCDGTAISHPNSHASTQKFGLRGLNSLTHVPKVEVTIFVVSPSDPNPRETCDGLLRNVCPIYRTCHGSD